MNKKLVLYHANCPDGFAAAWAAWRKFENSADYIPCHYGQPARDITGYERVYIVDFSFPRAVLEEWSAKLFDLKVIDHHKTAEADLKDLPYCIFDQSHSGAVLAWKFFHPDQPVPGILLYVEDRDLWKWELPKSREVSAALRQRSVKENFYAFNEIVEAGITSELVFQGETILAFQMQLVNALASKPLWRTIGGHKVPTVNTSLFFSETTEKLCENFPDAPFSACWFERQDGKRQWRLTSRGGFDVSVIAKQYGGGGHAAAAGFETAGDL